MNKMKKKQTAWVLLMTFLLIKMAYPAMTDIATHSPNIVAGILILAVWYLLFEEIMKKI